MSIRIKKIDHLGIAVPALAEARAAFEALGFTVTAEHEVPTEKVKAAFLPVGESHLELLEPTDPTSVIARFLEKRGGCTTSASSSRTSTRPFGSSRPAGCASSTRRPGWARAGAGWPSSTRRRRRACCSS